MNKRVVAVLCESLLCMLFAATFAFAAPAEVPRTGQTDSFAAGDDGSQQAGTAWPAPRFSTNADTSVTDNLTGLIWAPDGNLMLSRDPGYDTDDADDGRVTFQHAGEYIAHLNSQNYLGHNDWRLSNMNELQSLANRASPGSPSAWLNSQGFTNVQSFPYWSSTLAISDIMWTVDMSSGYTYMISMGGNRLVWPVRGGEAGAVQLPKTGQTGSLAEGDDGDLQQGVAWPEPLFEFAIPNIGSSVNPIGADQLTGLIWPQDGSSPTVGACTGGQRKWQEALDYVACLNANDYLGYNDWRLPNIDELRSHVNYGQTNTAAWLNTQGFTNVYAGRYWSSTSKASSYSPSAPPDAWTVDMGDNIVSTSDKLYNRRVWPVRGGQSESFVYLTVTASGDGTGRVSLDPGALLWSGNTGTASYGAAMTVNITATPAEGSAFTGWSGACTGTGVCEVTMDSSKSAVATFAITASVTTFTVTPSAGTGGGLSPNSARTVNEGATTVFTVTPNTGYQIGAVAGCGGTLSGSTYTTGAVTADCTVTASFTLITASPVVPTGDLNNDGAVDAADALMALKMAAGIDAVTSSDLQQGDVAPLVSGTPQPDGKIDIGDVVVLLRRAAALADW